MTAFKSKGSLFDQAALKCPAFNDVDSNNKKTGAGGYCVITDHDGDEAYLKWQNEGDMISGPGTFEHTGGTGKYKGSVAATPLLGSRRCIGRTGRLQGMRPGVVDPWVLTCSSERS